MWQQLAAEFASRNCSYTAAVPATEFYIVPRTGVFTTYTSSVCVCVCVCVCVLVCVCMCMCVVLRCVVSSDKLPPSSVSCVVAVPAMESTLSPG